MMYTHTLVELRDVITPISMYKGILVFSMTFFNLKDYILWMSRDGRSSHGWALVCTLKRVKW